MKFWDASALVPLCIDEDMTQSMRKLIEEDHEAVAWWLSGAEIFSALCRRNREGSLSDSALMRARKRRDILFDSITVIKPIQRIVTAAERVLNLHPLRCADAMQLGSAIVTFERILPNAEFVTLDLRLASAARREGFAVIDGRNYDT